MKNKQTSRPLEKSSEKRSFQLWKANIVIVVASLVLALYSRYHSLIAPATDQQLTTVETIAELASKHPLYSKSLADWKGKSYDSMEMPILQKQQIIDYYYSISPTDAVFDEAYLSISGGTSGKTVFFVSETQANKYQRKIIGNLFFYTGCSWKGNRAAILHSASPMYQAMSLISDIVEYAHGTTLRLSSTASDDEVVRYCMTFACTSLHGSSTRLVLLARHLHSARYRLEHVQQLVFSAENLSNEQESFLREIFGARVRISSILGSAEVGPYGVQPYWIPKGYFIIDLDCIHVDIFDQDENGIGDILITNLIRKKIPLLRYETGDVGSLTLPPTPGMKGLQWIADHFKLRDQSDILQATNESRMKRFAVLQMLGRNPKKSFQFWTSFYQISTFTQAISETKGVLQHQIVITQESFADYMTVNVVLSSDSTDIAKVRQEITKKLLQIFADPNFQHIISVDAVTPQQLRYSETGGKVVPLVDLRRN